MAHPAFDTLLAAALGDDDFPETTGKAARSRSRGLSGTLPSAQPPLAIAEETALLQRLRGESETSARSAFSTLYNAYVHPLWRFAVRLTGSASHAEEIVQDVFTRVWMQRTSWNPPGGVGAYLFRAVRNQAIDRKRHAEVAGRIGPEAADSMRPIPGYGEPSAAPDEGPVSEELRRILRTVLDRLPERRRSALVLRYVRAMSHAQIGEVLGITEKAAFILVARARESLKPVLQKFLEKE